MAGFFGVEEVAGVFESGIFESGTVVGVFGTGVFDGEIISWGE